MNPLRLEITLRPYPEERPPRGSYLTTRHGFSMVFFNGENWGWFYENGSWIPYEDSAVSHFALPSDIRPVDAPPEGRGETPRTNAVHDTALVTATPGTGTPAYARMRSHAELLEHELSKFRTCPDGHLEIKGKPCTTCEAQAAALRVDAGAAQPMEFSAGKRPAKAGWYWFQPDRHPPEVLRIFRDGATNLRCEWTGSGIEHDLPLGLWGDEITLPQPPSPGTKGEGIPGTNAASGTWPPSLIRAPTSRRSRPT